MPKADHALFRSVSVLPVGFVSCLPLWVNWPLRYVVWDKCLLVFFNYAVVRWRSLLQVKLNEMSGFS